MLSRKVELTVLTRETLTKHNEFAQSSELTAILADTNRLKSYLYGNDVNDLLRTFPVQHTPDSLAGILRKLPPRLYSIASSLKEHESEVHLTVGAVRYESGERRKEGLASCFLADRVGVEGAVKVFIERNEGFKLPHNSATDIIMVGPGTGIAPFRAFVEERANDGATGKNWLFFGNPHFTTDFLYQTEWQQWLKKGVLSKLHVAFSRDQAEKVYVQHKLLANSKDIFSWLEGGASFYVCGDKNRMAHDVEAALRLIVQQESGTSPEKAAEYVKSLKKQRRYLEDVY
jgi:sulfite reductase (NADPH) flavoprotein alpha-component